MHFTDANAAVTVMRSEYCEMPGLQLTFGQARRLWSLSEDLCERALGSLTHSGFLVRTSDGRYMRPTDPVSPAAAASPLRLVEQG